MRVVRFLLILPFLWIGGVLYALKHYIGICWLVARNTKDNWRSINPLQTSKNEG